MSYKITILESSEDTRKYAKSLEASASAPQPYYNKYRVFAADTFEKFYNLYSKLQDSPTRTQILGSPTVGLMKAREDGSVPENRVRRTAQNFNFFPDPDQLDPVGYNYMILDIDGWPDDMHIPSWRESMDEHNMTPTLVEDQARSVLTTLWPDLDLDIPDIPVIVRLSGSFGLKTFNFRGHIIVPVSEEVTITDLQVFLAPLGNKGLLDVSFYKNPTQPIYTAAPLGHGEEHLDPLASTRLNIPRLYMFKGDNFFPASLILESVPNSSHTFSRAKPDSSYPPASKLPGSPGVFNRAAEQRDEYSVTKWLIDHGYKQSDSDDNRWVSPSSTSGQAGLVIYPGNYLKDFHDHSPVQDLLQSHSANRNRILSPYDLYYLEAKEQGRLKAFRAAVKSLCSEDRKYQNFYSETINERLTFLTEGLSVSELQQMIEGFVEDIFYHGISTLQRANLFDRIVQKAPKIDGKAVTITQVREIYAKLIRKLAVDQLEVHPGNKDLLNAEAFLSMIRAYRVLDGSYYLIESPTGNTFLPIPSEEVIRQYVSYFISKISLEPHQWDTGKKNSMINAVISCLNDRMYDPMHKSPKMNKGLMAFKGATSGINVSTGKIQEINLQHFVANSLPFERDDYLACTDLKFEETNWGKFLTSTFANSPDRIKHVQDLFTYLFLPERSRHIIAAFTGVPRSGKSTIKNIMTLLLGEALFMETSPTSLSEEVGLNALTPDHRLLVVDEFNASAINKRWVNGESIVNKLKALSGKDKVIIRRMRENPISIYSDALPLLVSNELPRVKDKAFQDRLEIVRFQHTFSDKAKADDGAFFKRLKSELPYIFHWAITNPRYSSGDLTFHRSDTQAEDRDLIQESMDIHRAFVEKYICEREDSRIPKKEMWYFFNLYFQMKNGYPPTEAEMDHKKLAVQIFQDMSPRARNVRFSRSKITTVPELSDSLSAREWGINFIGWIDFDGMVKELSEFSDHIDEK